MHPLGLGRLCSSHHFVTAKAVLVNDLELDLQTNDLFTKWHMAANAGNIFSIFTGALYMNIIFNGLSQLRGLSETSEIEIKFNYSYRPKPLSATK